jgi:hypothetical protein
LSWITISGSHDQPSNWYTNQHQWDLDVENLFP